MAFKTVKDQSKFENGDQFKFDKKGSSITGYYLGSSVIEINGEPVLKHSFRTKEGRLIEPLGKTDMNRKLEHVPAGALARVTYSDDRKIKGRPVAMKQFTVEVDEEDTIDVSPKVQKTSSPESKKLA